MNARRIAPLVLLVLALIYPVLTMESAVYQRMGALVLLAAIGASAWNIVGGYAGQVSVGHAVFFGIGAYSSVVAFVYAGLPPIVGRAAGYGGERRPGGPDRRADAASLRPLLQHGDYCRR